VSVFTKKNALVGYLVLKSGSRWLGPRRNRQKRRGAKIAAFVTLGVVSVGIVAAIAAVLYRRAGEEGSEMQGYAIGDDESEIVGEYVTAPESLPAT
jgi:hypothetical protein